MGHKQQSLNGVDMADRYLRIRKMIDKETKNRAYTSTLYPQINPSNTDIVTIVKVGAQRLDILSYRYYGTPDYWYSRLLVDYLSS